VAPEPQHNHSLDSQTHPDCEQCKTYGNPMDPQMAEEEFEVSHDIQSQLQDIVSKMNASTLSDPIPPPAEDQEQEQEQDWEEYEEPPEDDDPLDSMEYGDDLELEE
jgi:hypothetical protein